MAKLAISGGEKVRTEPWPSWPVWDEREIEALEATVRSGHWGRRTLSKAPRSKRLLRSTRMQSSASL